MSRDLLDFSLSGRWPVVRFLVQTVPFMNARLQGLYKLGRAAKDDPARFAAVSGAVAMASLALMLAQEDDPDWKKREDWDRDAYWWFKIGDTAFRLPKPFEVGAIGTLAERSWELAFNKEMGAKRFGDRLSAMLFQTFAFDPTPQIVKPLLDVYANQESFTGRPIETMGMENLRKEDRASETTSGVARLLGQLGLPDPAQLAKGRYEPLSPVQVDSLVRGYFGWLGATAVAFTDIGMRPLMGRGERPNWTLKDLSLGFAEGPSGQNSRYMTAFYEQSQAIDQAWASYRDALKRGDPGRAREILVEEGDKIRNRGAANSAERSLSAINQQIKRVEASTEMSGEEKRRMLNQLRDKRGKIAERGLAAISD